MSSEYMQFVERKRKHLRFNSGVSGNAEHMLELILRKHYLSQKGHFAKILFGVFDLLICDYMASLLAAVQGFRCIIQIFHPTESVTSFPVIYTLQAAKMLEYFLSA